jgi:protocatechuate 3,4-dioxygenase beta subunit
MLTRIAVFVVLVSSLACASHGQPLSPTTVNAEATTLPSETERGERLTVSGRVLDGVDLVPVAGAVLFVYQTDAHGHYSLGGLDENTADARHPRLFARLRTARDGRYKFHTIKPGHYPSGPVPMHIHYQLSVGNLPAQNSELYFDGDPRLTLSIRAQAAKTRGRAMLCVPRKTEQGRLECEDVNVFVR